MAISAATKDASHARGLTVVEHDLAGEWTVAWSFPGGGAEQECLLLARSAEITEATFSRSGDDWVYSAIAARSDPKAASSTEVIVHLTAAEYHPERWLALAGRFVSYVASGAPLSGLTALFLEVVTAGRVAVGPDASGEWEVGGWKQSQALVAGGQLAGVCRILGRDFLRVWSALMLRKRVMVCAPAPHDLCAALRALPLLVAHRGADEWSRLRPVVGKSAALASSLIPAVSDATTAAELAAMRSAVITKASEASSSAVTFVERCQAAGGVEVTELLQPGWSVAGTTCEGLEGAGGALWDLWIDLAGRRVVVSPGGRSAALLGVETPAHDKVLSVAAAAAAEARTAGADTSVAVGRAIAAVSKELVEKLRTVQPVTHDSLATAGISGPFAAFMQAVAQVEPGIATA